MKTVTIKAGERRRIIRRFSNSITATYHFTAAPVNISQNLSGTIEVAGSKWLFPKPVTTQKLQLENSVDKGMWDTFYSVYVIPDCDVNVTMAPSGFPKAGIYLAIAATIIAIGLFSFFLGAV